MLLMVELDLFAIDTIILPKLKVLRMMSNTKIDIDIKIDIDVEIHIDAKTNINAKVNTNAKICTNAKIDNDAKIDTDMKIGRDKPIFHSPHTHEKISVNITSVRIKCET